MPRGDGTGPMGMGPMTGRAAGYCAGYAAPGFANPAFGCYGRGRGFRRMNPVAGLPIWGGYAGYSGVTAPLNDNPEMARLAAQQEANWLTQQIGAMERALQSAKERLAGLNKGQE
jgi:hypothetical protein